MDSGTTTGIVALIAQADAIQQFVALILLVMSITTWYLILSKTWEVWQARQRGKRAMNAFLAAPNVAVAIERMRDAADANPYTSVAEAVSATSTHYQHHFSRASGEIPSVSEAVALVTQRSVRRESARLISGLVVLASIGATSPFVGLFGTVWGIRHALVGIGFTAQATIDKVAGPVGEALMMTAFGLAVAIPAVLGYNFLLRAVRAVAADLEDFAHDIYAFAVTGVRPPNGSLMNHSPVQLAQKRAGGK
jgi:biopolymer transport protein ExbB